MKSRPVVLIALPVTAYGLGYGIAPQEQLDEEVKHTGFRQVDTSKVLATTMESFRNENKMLVFAYNGTARVRVSRTWASIIKGQQELLVRAVVNYYMDRSKLSLTASAKAP